MNIHVARTPHFCTGLTHTCCQGQTGSLTVRPDTARWVIEVNYLFHADSARNYLFKKNFNPPPLGNQIVAPLAPAVASPNGSLCLTEG